MNKNKIRNSHITKLFLDWISAIEDRGAIPGFPNYSSFEAAFNAYQWGDDNSFVDTYDRFTQYRSRLLNNPGEAKSICTEIIKWGGVESKNLHKLDEIGDINKYLKNVLEFIKHDDFPDSAFKGMYISSGFSKIYSSLDEKFIIYDSRVSFSFCIIIAEFCREYGLIDVPTELKLGYTPGRSGDRDPSEKNGFSFSNVQGRPEAYFKTNIHANWLIDFITDLDQFRFFKQKDKDMFAFQSALFMMGE